MDEGEGLVVGWIGGGALKRPPWASSVVADADAERRTFAYCEESHPAVRDGTFEAPSVMVRMPFATAVAGVFAARGGRRRVRQTARARRCSACEEGERRVRRAR